jgi:inner membrane protein
MAAITGLLLAVCIHPLQDNISLGTLLACLVANQLGGIAPDIDQPTAPLWRNLPVGGIFGKIISKMLGGHRFLTHSLIGVVLLGWLMRLLLIFIHPLASHLSSGYIWWAFMIGVISHLIMDTLTKEGVPWLLPIPVKFGLPPLKKLRITTDKWPEHFVVLPVLIVTAFTLCATNYHTLVTLLQTRIG